MKKLFTLIELIVVIVVIGILAAIVIPNISNFQKEGTNTAIKSNLRNLQTSVDMFSLENNGDLPGMEDPTPLKPVPINFKDIHPDYTRNLPKTVGVKYWIDYKGKVWASTVDSPTNVKLENLNTLSWDNIEDAQKYNIYEVTHYKASIGSAYQNVEYSFVKEVEEFTATNEGKVEVTGLEDKVYAVSAIDEQGFETPPVGYSYEGYNNQKPVAILSISNKGILTNATTINWDTSQSYDPDGDELQKFEWNLNNEIVNSITSIKEVGSHTVKLRVQDAKGMWSEWAPLDLEIIEASMPINNLSVNSLVVDKATNRVWKVIDHNHYKDINNPNIENHVTLMPLNPVGSEVFNSNYSTYADSSIRTWLTGTFFNTLPSDFRANTIPTKIPYSIRYSYTPHQTGMVTDRIFLMSVSEIDSTRDWNDGELFTEAFPNKTAVSNISGGVFWLRSNDMTGTNPTIWASAMIPKNGSEPAVLQLGGWNNKYSVRPIVNIKSSVKVSTVKDENGYYSLIW